MSVIHRPDWVYKSHVFDRWLPEQKLFSWSFTYGANCMRVDISIFALTHTPMITLWNFARAQCSSCVIWMWDHHHHHHHTVIFRAFSLSLLLPFAIAHLVSSFSNVNRLYTLFGWKAINKEACKWNGSDGFVSNTHYTHPTHPKHERIQHIQHRVTEIHMLKSVRLNCVCDCLFRHSNESNGKRGERQRERA